MLTTFLVILAASPATHCGEPNVNPFMAI